MIYTIKLCNKTIHNVRSKKEFVCVQTIYCIKDTIYCFLMTYLLLDTINFARFGTCLSEEQVFASFEISLWPTLESPTLVQQDKCHPHLN
jgi:hypothetical protein